jgi:hypothetical protein
MWLLLLNRMTDEKVEYLTPVAVAESREALEAFVASERVPYYQTDNWGKEFRQGGPLEWFNPPMFDPERSFVDIGTRDEYLMRKADEWDRDIGSLPMVQ